MIIRNSDVFPLPVPAGLEVRTSRPQAEIKNTPDNEQESSTKTKRTHSAATLPELLLSEGETTRTHNIHGAGLGITADRELHVNAQHALYHYQSLNNLEHQKSLSETPGVFGVDVFV